MVQLEWVFLLQVVTGILILMLLLRINAIKKQMDGIIKEVKNYVDFITEEGEYEENNINIEETDVRVNPMQKKAVNMQQKDKEEAQNYVIQAVLKEYFP